MSPTSTASRKPRRLQDLELSFFDTSGPNSRGVHCVWFVDGEFAHLTTGAADFDPTNPNDDQFYMIVDLRDPRHPREVGRWWYPGTRKGDACLPELLADAPSEVRRRLSAAQIEVWPDHPDRAYVAYIDGGAFILDISGLADVKAGRAKSFTPKVLARPRSRRPTRRGRTPFSRSSAAAWRSFRMRTRRTTARMRRSWSGCSTFAPKRIRWSSTPRRCTPTMASCARAVADLARTICIRTFPGPTSANLKNTTVASWFNGGVRIFHIVDGPTGVPNAPPHLEEIGYLHSRGACRKIRRPPARSTTRSWTKTA